MFVKKSFNKKPPYRNHPKLEKLPKKRAVSKVR